MEAAFHQQHGKTLNFAAFSKAVAQLNDWYKSRGLLGQVGPSRSMQGLGLRVEGCWWELIKLLKLTQQNP